MSVTGRRTTCASSQATGPKPGRASRGSGCGVRSWPASRLSGCARASCVCRLRERCRQSVALHDEATGINADVTISLHRHPIGEWVCLEFGSFVNPHGVEGLAGTRLHDEHGPIGRVAQTLLLEPIGERADPAFAGSGADPTLGADPKNSNYQSSGSRSMSVAISSNSWLRMQDKYRGDPRAAGAGRRGSCRRAPRSCAGRPRSSSSKRSEVFHLKRRRQLERLERREFLLLSGPALQRAFHPVGHRLHEAIGQLALLDLRLHDLAERRPANELAWSAAARAGLPRGSPAERCPVQLVLLGVREEFDFVDGCHRRGMVATGGKRESWYLDRCAPTGPLSRTGSIRVMRLSDGVEWGVHACVCSRSAPRRGAARCPARRVPRRAVGDLAKHLQALARAGVLETVKDRGAVTAWRVRRATSPCSTWWRRSTATSRRSVARRSGATGRAPCPARVPDAVRSTARSPAPTKRGEPSSRRRTSPISWWEWCRKQPRRDRKRRPLDQRSRPLTQNEQPA